MFKFALSIQLLNNLNRSKNEWDAWGNEVETDINLNGFVEAKKGEEIFNNSFPQQTLFGDGM